MRAEQLDAPGQFVAGAGDRAACHHHRARSPSAGRVRGHRGVPVHDLDLVGIDPEDLVRDLSKRRLQPLAVRVHADPQFEPAGRGHSRRCLLVTRNHRHTPRRVHRRPVRRLLAKDREPHPDPPPVGLATLLALAHREQIDRCHGAAQALRVVPAVEVFVRDVVERHLLRSHEVLQAQLDWIHRELASDRVKQNLEGEAHPGSRDPAVGENRWLVRGDRPGAAAIAIEVVGSGKNARHLRRLKARRERIRRIRARVDVRLAIDREQRPVGGRVAGNHVVVLAAVGICGELLTPVLDPAHGVASVHRDPAEADLLGQQDPLVAEAAADVGRDDPYLPLLEAEAIREPGANDVRHLARGVDDEHLEAPVPLREDAASLDRRHALARSAKRARHRHRCAGLERAQIRVNERLEKDVVAPVLVQERRVRVAREACLRDRGELLEVELDRRCEVLGLGPRRRHARGHQLPDVTDALAREHRLLRDLEAGQPRARDDGLHTAQILGEEHSVSEAVGLPRPAHPCVGERASHEGDLPGPREPDVGDEFAAPVQVPVILLARQPRADPTVTAHAPDLG